MQILIEVADNGIPSLTTQREFGVIILDVDDHLPEFAVSICTHLAKISHLIREENVAVYILDST